MTDQITVTSPLHAETLRVTLPDGRDVTLHPSGEILVRQQGFSDYMMYLPTQEQVAEDCQDSDRCKIQVPAYHRH